LDVRGKKKNSAVSCEGAAGSLIKDQEKGTTTARGGWSCCESKSKKPRNILRLVNWGAYLIEIRKVRNLLAGESFS